jgi:hypothetical protein
MNMTWYTLSNFEESTMQSTNNIRGGDHNEQVAAQDGLLALDANTNGAIDGLSELIGSNQQDGISQASELQTLASAGITAINLATTAVHLTQGDNVVSAIGSFERNGQTQLAADVDLVINHIAPNSIATCAVSAGARGRFDAKTRAVNDARWRATA